MHNDHNDHRKNSGEMSPPTRTPHTHLIVKTMNLSNDLQN